MARSFISPHTVDIVLWSSGLRTSLYAGSENSRQERWPDGEGAPGSGRQAEVVQQATQVPWGEGHRFNQWSERALQQEDREGVWEVYAGDQEQPGAWNSFTRLSLVGNLLLRRFMHGMAGTWFCWLEIRSRTSLARLLGQRKTDQTIDFDLVFIPRQNVPPSVAFNVLKQNRHRNVPCSSGCHPLWCPITKYNMDPLLSELALFFYMPPSSILRIDCVRPMLLALSSSIAFLARLSEFRVPFVFFLRCGHWNSCGNAKFMD